MIIILICVVISQVLLQKDELWIERNSSNDQISDGNYHIFRKYQIEGQVHNIQEYRDKFSYYLFILTSKDNYFSLIILQDPADDFRKQTIFRAQNQSCDHKFVINQFYILWRCHTTKDIFYLYNLETKLYKVQKLMDVSDNYFIFDFSKLIRYSNHTLRLYTINDNQLSSSSQYDSNFTILDHFDNQQNALIISEQNIYVVWYKFEGSNQANQLKLYSHKPYREFMIDEDVNNFDYSNSFNLVKLYFQGIQKDQYISWHINYQSDYINMSYCQIYDRTDQILFIYEFKTQNYVKSIQINDTALPFLNLYTQDLYLFDKELRILFEINYKSYYQLDYLALLSPSNIQQINNSKYIYQNEMLFAFLNLKQQGQFPYAQIYIGGDIEYRYSQMDQFDKLRINFKTVFFTETVNYECIRSTQIFISHIRGYRICQFYNNSFIIEYIGKSYQNFEYYYYDNIIDEQDYVLYRDKQMIIARQYLQVLHVYKLTNTEKFLINTFIFDEVDFYQQYAFIYQNGNALKYDLQQDKTHFLGNQLFEYKILYDDIYYAYRDSKLILANYHNNIFIILQNLNLNSLIIRMFIITDQIFIISLNQIQKFEKINHSRILLTGNLELYGNIINEKSIVISDGKQFIYIQNGQKFLIINTKLSLSQALVSSIQMEIQQQLLFAADDKICFRIDTQISCSKLKPYVSYKIDFVSIQKSYQVLIQLESSNKYDTQRYQQSVEIFQTSIPMKIIHNKTVLLNSQINLGKEWYQGNVIQVFSNNQDVLRYIREKRYILYVQFLQYSSQKGDYLIFYANYGMIQLYNRKDDTYQFIKYPEQCQTALIFKEYILYSCLMNQIHIYQCQQFTNCSLVKILQIDDQFLFNYDNFEYIKLRFLPNRTLATYELLNLSLNKVFQFKFATHYDYYIKDRKIVSISYEISTVCIKQEQETCFNQTFQNFNSSLMESIYKIKLLNENHFLVSFKQQGLYIYHFDKEIHIKYILFPHQRIRRQVTNVIQLGIEYYFGIQTEDNFIFIYKAILDNTLFEESKILEPEIQLTLEDFFYYVHFQLFYYENYYQFVMLDNKKEALIVYTVNFNNILKIEDYFKSGKLKIRISDLEQFETMELTITQEQDYNFLFLLIFPIIYIIIRFKQLKHQY